MQIRRAKGALVVLTSYEFLINKKDAARLAALPWRYLVLDEGHRIKNADCQLSRALRTYKIAHKLLLTGTPLQNQLSELWSLLNFLVRACLELLPCGHLRCAAGNTPSQQDVLLQPCARRQPARRVHATQKCAAARDVRQLGGV